MNTTSNVQNRTENPDILLKSLINYLPYSLKVMMEGKICNVAWMSTKNIAVHRPGGIGDYKKIAWKYASKNIKPILKPKQQILKNLTSNYDRCEQWEQEWIDHILDFQDKLDEANFDACPFDLMQHLLENHFDVFDLIPQAIAININDIK